MSGTTTSDKVLASFLAGKPRAIRNDSSIAFSNYTRLNLHGNEIACRYHDGAIIATLAGWPTVTTRDRLNALCDAINLRRGFSQSKNVQYYAGEVLDPDSWVWIRASDSAIAAERKGLRLPKGYTFEKSKWSDKIEIQFKGHYVASYFDTEKEARDYAKDRLAEQRALAELTKAKDAQPDNAPEYSEPGKVNCKFGAPMGRGSSQGGPDAAHVLHLRGLHIDSGGYDNGGAYWGTGAPMFHIQGEEVEHFIRSHNRDNAKAWVLEQYPNATFTS